MTAGPSLLPLSNVTLLAGAPLEIPINATSPSGYTLSYSATSTNSAISADVQNGNPDLVLNITHTASSQSGDTSFSGTIVIELFPDAAPNTVAQIEKLAEAGVYNNTDFYRIVPDFVAQAGLDGAALPSGVTANTLDDEFNFALPIADPTQPLRYSSIGVVGVARETADDSGSTEFFITTSASDSNLDYQYTVFGQVVSGMNILTDIGNVPNDSSNNNEPYSPVTITSATITTDNNDFALGLSAPLGTTGTGTVTVTANDGHGGTTSQSFQVTVQADPNDPGPILESIPTITTTVNTPVVFQLPAFDLEGDPITYFDQTGLQSTFELSPTQPISSDLNVSVNSTTGAVNVTPTNGLVGVTPMFFGVASSDTSSLEPNTQMAPLFIDPAPPTSVALEAASDTGASNSDDITSLNNSSPGKELQFLVSGVTSGDTVTLFDGSTEIGSAVASGSTVVVTTDGSTVLADGVDDITATQALVNQQYTVGNDSGTTTLSSAASNILQLTVDSAGPTFTSTPNTKATIEAPYSYTAQASDIVSGGLRYAVVSAPAGFTIDATDGAVTWTPTFAQLGANPVEISVTDLAGNTIDQSFNVTASFGPFAVASITPPDGAANVPVNSSVQVQFNNLMNSDTINSTTLLLEDSMGNSVASDVSYNAATGVATITPNADFANSAAYTVTVVGGEDGVADANGDTLAANVAASFTTEAPLSVVSVSPTAGSTDVPLTTSISVVFDNAMNPTTLNSTTLQLENSQGVVIAANVAYDSTTNTVTVTPTGSLTDATTYTLTVLGGDDGVADTGGEILNSDFTASFTTVARPTVVSVAPINDDTGVPTTTAVNVVFSTALTQSTVDSSTVELKDSFGNVVAATVAYNAGANTATITPTAPLAPGATFEVFVTGGDSGIADADGNTMAADFVSSFTTAIGTPAPTPSPGETTLFSNSTVPPYSDNPDSQAVELGVQFTSSESGYIVGIRFYKGASSSGTNIGNLWSSSGTLLVTATFSDETASGWQEVNFSQPVAIQAGATYIASYFAPNGNYADNLGFFAGGGLSSGPLTASGSVYGYSATSKFPTQTYDNSNYYVDVVFSPLVGTVSPATSATGISTSSSITIPFLTAMDSESINSSTIQLENSSGGAVAANVTYDELNDTATLSPNATLTPGTTYTVVITGGAGGVADANGNELPSNVTWTFTTAPGAPAVQSITPAAAATGVDENAVIQITFNEGLEANTVTSSNIVLQNSSGSNVAATLAYNSNNNTVTLMPDAALDASATYTVVVEGGNGGILDGNGAAMAANFTSTFTTAAALGSGTFSLWSDSTTPAWVDNPDPRSIELGLRFESTSGGDITGIRFYQSSANTGSHTINLWSSAGTLLATATSSSTSGPGWVEISFSSPVYIRANTVYVASYFTSVGNYSDNIGFFNSGSVSAGPLTALGGVYNYGSTSAFPSEVYEGSNYWVDVVLEAPPAQSSPAVQHAAVPNAAQASDQTTGKDTAQSAAVPSVTPAAVVSASTVQVAAPSLTAEIAVASAATDDTAPAASPLESLADSGISTAIPSPTTSLAAVTAAVPASQQLESTTTQTTSNPQPGGGVLPADADSGSDATTSTDAAAFSADGDPVDVL